jgi:hypothetical protein
MALRALLAFACAAAALQAQAYCIHNQLRDRDIFIEQEPVKDKLREDRTLSMKLGPGKTALLPATSDCNPAAPELGGDLVDQDRASRRVRHARFAEGTAEREGDRRGTLRSEANPADRAPFPTSPRAHAMTRT